MKLLKLFFVKEKKMQKNVTKPSNNTFHILLASKMHVRATKQPLDQCKHSLANLHVFNFNFLVQNDDRQRHSEINL